MRLVAGLSFVERVLATMIEHINGMVARAVSPKSDQL